MRYFERHHAADVIDCVAESRSIGFFDQNRTILKSFHGKEISPSWDVATSIVRHNLYYRFGHGAQAHPTRFEINSRVRLRTVLDSSRP